MDEVFIIFNISLIGPNEVRTVFPESFFTSYDHASSFLTSDGWRENTNTLYGEHFIKDGKVAKVVRIPMQK